MEIIMGQLHATDKPVVIFNITRSIQAFNKGKDLPDSMQDKYDIYAIAPAPANRKDNIFMQR